MLAGDDPITKYINCKTPIAESGFNTCIGQIRGSTSLLLQLIYEKNPKIQVGFPNPFFHRLRRRRPKAGQQWYVP